MGDTQKNSEVEIFLSDEEKRSSRKKMDQVIGKEKKAIMIISYYLKINGIISDHLK